VVTADIRKQLLQTRPDVLLLDRSAEGLGDPLVGTALQLPP
jgi:hypothetical protein